MNQDAEIVLPTLLGFIPALAPVFSLKALLTAF
jgi:hypothetical protein